MLVRRRLLLIAAAISVSIGDFGFASHRQSADFLRASVSSSPLPSAPAASPSSPAERQRIHQHQHQHQHLRQPPETRVACKLSEFLCATGHCVAQDKFCDGNNDCSDKSDEPKFCNPCNRTLYGDVGRTYRLEVRRPREDRLPFLCHLNFSAAGGDFGDLVQLTFDTFTVGHFMSLDSKGCPDGYMTIREQDLPETGGQWCGSSWGYTVYYSETPSINLTLHLLRLSQQGTDYNFDFKLSYKFLRRSEAHLRYGNSSMAIWRGELVNGTYCDRVLRDCDVRACRLQSPNYPGIYARNVTCYYRIEQNHAPPGHRALLAVSQRNSHKIHIKDQLDKYDRSQRVLRVWDDCNVVEDYLTVYDGSKTSDRVLVKLCGGDAVPDIVSSNSTMLLQFHTSPYDSPFHPVPLSFLPGFELEVQVLFVDEKSRTFVRESNNCDFYISSEESPSGMLVNPKHSLPPNTTCRYRFRGKPNEIVWLSFVKYYAGRADPVASVNTASDCNAKLLVWDDDRTSAPTTTTSTTTTTTTTTTSTTTTTTTTATLATGTASSTTTTGPTTSDRVQPGAPRENVTLIAQFCKHDIPRLCDHSLLRNSSRQTRPCSLEESYVSTGRDLTLEHILREGSALYPISFVLRYEFVDEAKSCNRVFVDGASTSSVSSGSSGKFGSPRSVFLYGRGGARNLSCVYRFEAGKERRVELSIERASFGDKSCSSYVDPLLNRWTCDRRIAASRRIHGIAEILVVEYPWQGVELIRDCLCSNVSERIVLRGLTSATVELRFTVTLMNVTQDYEDFFFEGEFRFVGGEEPGCTNLPESRRLRGTNGEISLRSPAPSRSGSGLAVEEVVANGGDADLAAASQCVNEPWLIEPEEPGLNFLYLRTAGYAVTLDNVEQCPTLNRIIVYAADNTRQRSVICPEGGGGVEADRTVDLFSGGWNRSGANETTTALALERQHSRSFVVEFLQREAGFYALSWMAISRRASVPSVAFSPDQRDECPYRCPELQACISSVLWCDGVRHCPSGFDEEDGNCSYRFGLTLLYVAVAAGTLGVFLVLLLATGCLKYCLYRHRARRKKKNMAQSVNQLRVEQSHRNNGLTVGRATITGSVGAARYALPPVQDIYADNYGKDSTC